MRDLPDRLVTLTLTNLNVDGELTEEEMEGLLVKLTTNFVRVINEDGEAYTFRMFPGEHEFNRPDITYCSIINMIHDEEAVMDFTTDVQRVDMNNKLNTLANYVIREFKQIIQIVPEDHITLSEALLSRIKSQFEE